jgi:hypothetical protein
MAQVVENLPNKHEVLSIPLKKKDMEELPSAPEQPHVNSELWRTASGCEQGQRAAITKQDRCLIAL